MGEILFILILVLLLCQKGIIEPFKPNEKQYAICSDDSGDKKGETNYEIYHNELLVPSSGLLTSILNSTNESDYSNYLRSPECGLSTTQHHSYFPTNKIIDFESNTWIPLQDASNPYPKPTDNYSVIYPNIFNDKFIQQHEKLNESDPRFR